MSRHLASITFAMLWLAPVAEAGTFSDELGRCFVSSTTADDRVALARWIFIAFSAHPGVAPISTVTDADIERSNTEIGALFMKLLLGSCHDQAKAALKYEGTVALQSSFSILGQVAGMELASSPQAQARMAGLAQHIDAAKIGELVKEPDAPPAAPAK